MIKNIISQQDTFVINKDHQLYSVIIIGVKKSTRAAIPKMCSVEPCSYMGQSQGFRKKYMNIQSKNFNKQY
jgi:hypothetical protein